MSYIKFNKSIDIRKVQAEWPFHRGDDPECDKCA